MLEHTSKNLHIYMYMCIMQYWKKSLIFIHLNHQWNIIYAKNFLIYSTMYTCTCVHSFHIVHALHTCTVWLYIYSVHMYAPTFTYMYTCTFYLPCVYLFVCVSHVCLVTLLQATSWTLLPVWPDQSVPASTGQYPWARYMYTVCRRW